MTDAPAEPPVLNELDAARLTKRIQLRLDTIAANAEAVLPMIEEARDGKAYETLGYATWAEYVTDKFGDSLKRLDAAQKIPFMHVFAEGGLSVRAVASMLGTSVGSAHAGMKAAKEQVFSSEHLEPKTTGRDGKQYNAVRPAGPPHRKPLPDVYWQAVYELSKVVERLSRFHQDDRFTSNRPSIRERNLGLVSSLAEVLADLEVDLRGGDAK